MPSPAMPTPLPMVAKIPTSTSMSQEDYLVVKSLGSGKYGTVQEVQRKDSKKRMAWKRMHLKDGGQGLEVSSAVTSGCLALCAWLYNGN